MKMLDLTVIIPVYNGATVIEDVLGSLETQAYPIRKVIIVDDKSTDQSLKIVQKYKKKSHLNIALILHTKNQGLAQSYNSALIKVQTPYVVTLMQDCVLSSDNVIEHLIMPFLKNKTLIISCAKTINPLSTWKTYNFWLKCLMERHAGRILSGKNNSCCCYSYRTLKKIGFFNTRFYRTAGEDTDIFYRMNQIGNILEVNTLVKHIHNRNPQFGLTDYIRKENQRAEVCGVTFSHMKDLGFINILRIFARPFILLGLIIPYMNVVSLLLIVSYAYLYTEKVYYYEIRNPRIILLPFINIFLFISYTWYFSRGFITKKQIL
ncbi:glycosyltransferase family 2 protein [Candidatus Gottesmanbacteria bacterium]|nr:glycosyltransferase family 2 protein [Candidatus Gottesmanbacteria bacterium]